MRSHASTTGAHAAAAVCCVLVQELMRLVVKILQLQDALQSAVRPALHANALRSNHVATHMGAMSTML